MCNQFLKKHSNREQELLESKRQHFIKYSALTVKRLLIRQQHRGNQDHWERTHRQHLQLLVEQLTDRRWSDSRHASSHVPLMLIYPRSFFRSRGFLDLYISPRFSYISPIFCGLTYHTYESWVSQEQSFCKMYANQKSTLFPDGQCCCPKGVSVGPPSKVETPQDMKCITTQITR